MPEQEHGGIDWKKLYYRMVGRAEDAIEQCDVTMRQCDELKLQCGEVKRILIQAQRECEEAILSAGGEALYEKEPDEEDEEESDNP